MPQKKTDNTPETYHELSIRLDSVVAKLQDPTIDVDEAVTYYEEAVDLIDQLERSLERAQNQINEISRRFNADE